MQHAESILPTTTLERFFKRRTRRANPFAHAFPQHFTPSDFQWTLVRSANAKTSTARAKAKRRKDSHTRTRPRTQLNFDCGKRGHFSKHCWIKKDQTNRGGSNGKNKHKSATDAHNLDSTKPAYTGQEVEIGGFRMSCFQCRCC